MNLDDLGGQFDANKGPILATAAAGVIGFALYQRRKGGGAPAAGPAQGVQTVASAGGQTAGMSGGAAYDSSASDVYGLVQPQLESLGGQLTDLNAKLNGIPVSQGPGADASMLYKPTGSGTYVRYGTTIDEVEPNGSLYALTLPEWQALGSPGYTQLGTQEQHPATFYTGGGNLARRIAATQQQQQQQPAPPPVNG